MHDRSPILITGAGGFLGREVCRQLLSAGAEVHGTVRRRPPPEGIRAWSCELRDAASWQQVFEEVRPGLVIHLAAPVALSRDPAGWAALSEGILGVSDRVARSCLATRSRLVQVGTCEVYGDGPAPFREDQAARPVSPYSTAKLAASAWVGCLARTRGLDALIVRPFLTYGPDQEGARLVPTAIDAALARRPFPMTEGTQSREINYLTDTARGICLAAMSDAGGGEIINIGGGPELPIHEIVERIYQLCGADPDLIQRGALPQRGGETARFAGDHTRARSWLDFRPQVSLTEGLRRTIASRRGA